MFKKWLTALLFWAVAGVATAAPTYVLTEDFDDAVLDGWDAATLGTPGGATSWFLGNAGVFTAHQGADESYAAANFEAAPFGGAISTWLFTPVLDWSTGLNLSFFTRSNGALPDRLEIYASTSGASTIIGDFSLLLSINPSLLAGGYVTEWTEYSTIFGGLLGQSGRFAFRYSIDDTSLNGDYIGIDTIRVAVPEPSTWALLALALGALLFARRRGRA